MNDEERQKEYDEYLTFTEEATVDNMKKMLGSSFEVTERTYTKADATRLFDNLNIVKDEKQRNLLIEELEKCNYWCLTRPQGKKNTQNREKKRPKPYSKPILAL